MMAPAVGRFIAESMYAGTTGDPLEQLAPDRFAAGRLLPERQVV
jgi:hypothetical protein